MTIETLRETLHFLVSVKPFIDFVIPVKVSNTIHVFIGLVIKDSKRIRNVFLRTSFIK